MKDTDINDSLHYLDFMCVCVCVCMAGGWGWSKTSIPHASQVGVTQSLPTKDLWEILYLVAGIWSRVLKLNKLDHLLKFFEVLNLIFACIYSEKD